MLVVFAKFRDDNFAGDPNVNYRQWPIYRNQKRLPPYAGSLLSSTPSPPFADSTLTDYFFQQSNGKMLVWGDVYPQVLVTEKDEHEYHRPQGGYGTLTTELLTRIDDAGFDFTRYDANKDGVLDHVFVILRRDSQRDARKETYTGISCLDARCGGSITANRKALPELVFDSVTVDWDRSGSYLYNRTAGNIVPQLWLVRLMAHELGHDIWNSYFNHVPGLADNDSPLHIGRQRHAIGYVLMAGAGGARDTQGSATISAFERLLLGWIDCPALTKSTHVKLGDLYTTASCRLVNYTVNGRNRTLVLSNLQRVGFFDQLRRGGKNNRHELGLLRTVGLLAHVTDGRRTDVLAADGDLQLSNYDADYKGDLWSPAIAPQLTPWTRPTATSYKAGIDSLRRYFAIDDIRWSPGDTGALEFDFIEDFRRDPVIRSDSWMVPGDAPLVIAGSLQVVRGSTLYISTDVRVRGGIDIHPGATIQIEPSGSLTVESYKALSVRTFGALVVNGSLKLTSGPLLVYPGANLRATTGSLRHSVDR